MLFALKNSAGEWSQVAFYLLLKTCAAGSDRYYKSWNKSAKECIELYNSHWASARSHRRF
ncbi:hypothetical protein H6F61_07280 [Cyanobacteria bacterium FACHB-472]|nr:hypothetical protein [Cyanobacteria bacterium FACHB-472]